MLEIFQEFISLLTNDATLLTLIPKDHIFTGAVDEIQQKQADLSPIIVLSQVSEAVRTVPNTRDTQIQLDIWSRESQLDLENIYERVLAILDYVQTNQGDAHIFWQRLSGANDHFESDRRVWHRACTFVVWSQKN